VNFNHFLTQNKKYSLEPKGESGGKEIMSYFGRERPCTPPNMKDEIKTCPFMSQTCLKKKIVNYGTRS